MPTVKCDDCGGQVSTSVETCPHCGRPIKIYRKPLLTKPAGVFIQLLGVFFLFLGFLMLVINVMLGILVIALAIGLLWLGRQTHPRQV